MLVGTSIVANAILEDYKVLGRREEEAARLRAEAEELVKAARAGAEQLEKDRAAFEKQKQTSEWAATAQLKQIVQAIMDAPETATGLDLVKERARDAGFKAGYSRCVSHMNVMSAGGFTAERSGFRDVDTEGRLNAAVASFYDRSLSCVEKLDDCLEAADYVDRLRMLYADAEEETPVGGGEDDAGTSGTK
ncbi:hypothetical protein HanRHA438_Chr12g0558661 [Helianthus annuus]|nr:hypothetical protein HanRHA438_Chr12g0558661 [Helianthus annuus]